MARAAQVQRCFSASAPIPAAMKLMRNLALVRVAEA
jgi:hypothetical protein